MAAGLGLPNGTPARAWGAIGATPASLPDVDFKQSDRSGMCTTLHVLWSLVYIGCGAVQLVVGIFFLFASDLPFLRLGSNVVAGGWDVVVGVTGALVACVGPMSSPGRHEALLYMAVSVLAVNAVNLAVLELVEWKMLWSEEHTKAAEKPQMAEFLFYARLSTSAAALVAMVVSFLDSQLTFCTLQHAARRRQQRRRAAKGAHGHHGHHHDHSADSEYIILPRVRPSTKGGYEQYTRSWVFDVDGQGQQGQQGQGGNGASSSARYQQLDSHSHADKCRDAAAAAMASEGAGRSASRASTQRGDTYTIADAKALRAAIANGVPPDGLGSGSPGPSGPSGSRQYNRNQKHKELMREREHQKQLREQQQYQQRQQQHDKGRQRPSSTSSSVASSSGHGQGHGHGHAASPASRQQHSGKPQAQAAQPQPPIEESPPSGTSPDSPAVDSAESRSAHSPDSGELADQDGVGYHSLMSELTQAIRKKPSPKDDTSSADFNRELEAALQDIHDLDSSTGGTLVNASSAASSSAPPPPAPDWGDSDEESSACSASSRTVSGKRRSQPRLGRAFAIPVPPPVLPGQGTLRGTLRATQTGTLTSTLRRQWDHELRQLQQQQQQEQEEAARRERESAPTPEPPPPPPPALDQDLTPPSAVRSKTVVTICDGDMVVREMNNNDIVLLPIVLTPSPDEFPPAPSNAPIPVPEDSERVPSRTPTPPPSPSPPLSMPPSPPTAPAEQAVPSPEVNQQGCSMGSVGRLGGLSLLRKARRRSSGVRLSQELQGAVLQSESLVFLSDSELVARHERNRRVQREIEQRVQQQISGHSGSDSLC